MSDWGKSLPSKELAQPDQEVSQARALTSVLHLQEALDRGSMETARAILQHAVSVFPGKKSLYKALAQLERQHGTPEAVAEVLERGVKYCPQVTQ